MNKILGGLILASLVMAASGCSHSSEMESSALPPVGKVQPIGSPGDISRPIYSYLVTPAEIAEINQAYAVENNQCMRTYGLPGMKSNLLGFDEAAVRDSKAHDQLYGFFNPAVVATKGYDLVVDRTLQSSGNSQGQVGEIGSKARSVESGVDSEGNPIPFFNGYPVPLGGCMKKSVDDTGGALPTPFPEELPGGGPKVSLSDPRLVSLNQKWSDCMKEKGFHYSSPWVAMNDPKWHPTGKDYTVSKIQIATAVADLNCKERTNYMSMAIALQVAYDAQYIDSHGSDLAAFKDKLKERLRKAAETVRSSS